MNTLQPAKSTWQSKVFPLLILIGWIIVIAVFFIGLFLLTPTASSYWGGNTKAVRDAAEAGTPLLALLSVLVTIPRWLEPLTFLGVASFMTGIALAFSTIPNLLKDRGQLMSVCFPLFVKLGK